MPCVSLPAARSASRQARWARECRGDDRTALSQARSTGRHQHGGMNADASYGVDRGRPGSGPHAGRLWRFEQAQHQRDDRVGHGWGNRKRHHHHLGSDRQVRRHVEGAGGHGGGQPRSPVRLHHPGRRARRPGLPAAAELRLQGRHRRYPVAAGARPGAADGVGQQAHLLTQAPLRAEVLRRQPDQGLGLHPRRRTGHQDQLGWQVVLHRLHQGRGRVRQGEGDHHLRHQDRRRHRRHHRHADPALRRVRQHPGLRGRRAHSRGDADEGAVQHPTDR